MEKGLEKKSTSNETFIEKQLETCTATKRGNFPRSVGSTLVPIKIGSSPRFLLQASGALSWPARRNIVGYDKEEQDSRWLACSHFLAAATRFSRGTDTRQGRALLCRFVWPTSESMGYEIVSLEKKNKRNAFAHHDSKQIESSEFFYKCYKYKINKTENINRR